MIVARPCILCSSSGQDFPHSSPASARMACGRSCLDPLSLGVHFEQSAEAGSVSTPQTVILRGGFRGINGALFVSSHGSFTEMYQARYPITVNGREWLSGIGFKTQPMHGCVLLVSIRRLPSSSLTIVFPSSFQLDRDVIPVLGKQVIDFRLPWSP